MANRPYLTSAEAATYCGFKTIGGIQQAVRRGKLKPAGRRGGTGTYVFATADLDLFLTGGLQPHERLFVEPQNSQVTDRPAAPTRESSPPVKLLPKPPKSRDRKPAAAEDPVARITRALASGGPEKNSGPGKSKNKSVKRASKPR